MRKGEFSAVASACVMALGWFLVSGCSGSSSTLEERVEPAAPIEIKPKPEDAAPAEPQILHGVVRDGTNGEPLPRAIVISPGETRHDGVMQVTDDLLQEWIGLSDEDFFKHPKLHLLGANQRVVHHVMRTDQQGRFSVDLSKPFSPVQKEPDLPSGDRSPPDTSPVFLRTFRGVYPGKLGYIVGKPGYIRGLEQHAKSEDLGPIDLYPAARLKIRVNKPADTTNEVLSVGSEWRIAPPQEQEVPWYDRFEATEKRREIGSGMFQNHRNWLNVGEEQVIEIPAGVRMNVRFDDHRGWANRPTEWFAAKPGEILDRGEVELNRDLNLPVKVVDREGNPQEGALLRVRRNGNKFWFAGHMTGPDGIANILVGAGFAGDVGVEQDKNGVGLIWMEGRPEGVKVTHEKSFEALEQDAEEPIVLQLWY